MPKIAVSHWKVPVTRVPRWHIHFVHFRNPATFSERQPVHGEAENSVTFHFFLTYNFLGAAVDAHAQGTCRPKAALIIGF